MNLDTVCPNGYNLAEGGFGGAKSEKTKALLRARIKTPEWRRNLSNAMRGRKLSPEHRDIAIAALRRAGPFNRVGAANGNSKLGEQQVKEIRGLYKKGGISQEAIAARYGVGQTTVSTIITGRNWSKLASK